MNALPADDERGMIRPSQSVLSPLGHGRADLLDGLGHIAALQFDDYICYFGVRHDIICASAGGDHAAVHGYNPNLDAPICWIAKTCTPVVFPDDCPFSGILLNVTRKLTSQIQYPAAG